MLRRILLALDGAPSGQNAAAFALDLARAHRAGATALGIVNSAWIQRPQPVPLGGFGYKASLDLHLMTSASQRVSAVLEQFEETARAIGLSDFEMRAVEGDVVMLVQQEATSHDLLVLSREAHFDVEREGADVPGCVDRLVRAGLRPIIIAPASSAGMHDRSQPVLVGFDGSAPASRALHLFALLGLAAEAPVHLLCAGIDDAERQAAAARLLLIRHGCPDAQAIILTQADSASPSEAILAHAQRIGAKMIVMGAYGHRGLREIFGSCTRSVIEACPVPIFLHS
jgi:nucleotide-binding universal stress UspA family protein